jgi:hypothetical protein
MGGECLHIINRNKAIVTSVLEQSNFLDLEQIHNKE